VFPSGRADECVGLTGPLGGAAERCTTMIEIWKVLNECRAEIEAHPFFAWLSSDRVPLAERFAFTPVLIDFIMSFADLNKWFLRYAEPQGDWERAINQHTSEDATHSLLFVHNWAHLKLGETPEWPASKALWWMFHSSESLVVRQLGMEILHLSVELPDPLVRFPMMEAIEICGDVFFGHTTRIAEQLQLQHQVEHLYYGPYHRAKETGHLQADEGSFSEAVLMPTQRREAERAARNVFGQFSKLFDHMLDFSVRATSEPARLARSIDVEFAQEMSRPAPAASEAPGYLPLGEAGQAHETQLPLLGLLDERKARLRRHPFVLSLRDGPVSVERLQNLAPLWGVDVVSYKDFNELVLRYEPPRSEAECSINRWAEDLATHGVLYLQDWHVLGLDELLGWKLGDAVTYYFLSEHTEVHRRNMSKVKKLAMAHRQPLLRWWLMTALEESGGVLFGATRPLALALERELGAPLNYWAHRHGLVEPVGPRRAPHAFLGEPASARISEVVRTMIDTVFDNIEEQFDQCEHLLRSLAFSTEARLLPSRAGGPAAAIRATAC
jgi:hypothetical protein